MCVCACKSVHVSLSLSLSLCVCVCVCACVCGDNMASILVIVKHNPRTLTLTSLSAGARNAVFAINPNPPTKKDVALSNPRGVPHGRTRQGVCRCPIRTSHTHKTHTHTHTHTHTTHTIYTYTHTCTHLYDSCRRGRECWC